MFFVKISFIENKFDRVSFALGVRPWFSTGGNFVLWATFGISKDIFLTRG